MRIHLFAAGCAAIAGSALRIDIAEWRWLILAIGLVIAAEALNTGVEQACNAVSRDYRAEIKAAKDVSAAAVLVASIVAMLIGVSVLGPRLLELTAPRAIASALICGGPS